MTPITRSPTRATSWPTYQMAAQLDAIAAPRAFGKVQDGGSDTALRTKSGSVLWAIGAAVFEILSVQVPTSGTTLRLSSLRARR